MVEGYIKVSELKEAMDKRTGYFAAIPEWMMTILRLAVGRLKKYTWEEIVNDIRGIS